MCECAPKDSQSVYMFPLYLYWNPVKSQYALWQPCGIIPRDNYCYSSLDSYYYSIWIHSDGECWNGTIITVKTSLAKFAYSALIQLMSLWSCSWQQWLFHEALLCK